MGEFSQTSTLHPDIFAGWAVRADSVSLWMNTITSPDKWKPIRLGEIVVLSYKFCQYLSADEQCHYYERCSSSWFEMIADLIVCLTIESHRCGSRRFDRYTAGLHQAMVSTSCVTV